MVTYISDNIAKFGMRSHGLKTAKKYNVSSELAPHTQQHDVEIVKDEAYVRVGCWRCNLVREELFASSKQKRRTKLLMEASD